MKIAIDLDEVVVKFIEHFMDFIEKKGYQKVPFENFSSYSVSETLGLERSVVLDLLDEFNKEGGVFAVDFIEGSLEGILFLIKNHDIYFVTARSEGAIKDTKKFIYDNFGVLEEKIIFSGLKEAGTERKDKVCKDLGIGLIIEDSSSVLTYAENGIKVVLFDKPWNRTLSHENIFRCYNWEEILEKVEELSDE